MTTKVPPGYSVGRVVRVRVMRDWVPGVIVARHGGGWIDIQTDDFQGPIGIHASVLRRDVRLIPPQRCLLMTKAEEIALLNKTIKAFGPDSYIGSWLAESRMQIEDDITQDYPMSAPLPGEARRVGASIVRDARNEAERIVKEAEQTAREAGAAAGREIDATRARLHMDLMRAISVVEGQLRA